MRQETLAYQADGLAMEGQLFFEPGAAKRAGVLVFPEAMGLSQNALTRAERLAGMGYAALACDLHGGGREIKDFQEIMAAVGKLRENMQRLRDRAFGALHALTERPEVDAGRVASIGFCMGGTMSLELARAGADLKAVVGFHSGLGTQAPATATGQIKPRILVCIGADDPMVPPEDRAAFEAEMRAAKADWQMHVYGGVVHSFTNRNAGNSGMSDAMRYDAAADARSWAAMEGFFGETLG